MLFRFDDMIVSDNAISEIQEIDPRMYHIKERPFLVVTLIDGAELYPNYWEVLDKD